MKGVFSDKAWIIIALVCLVANLSVRGQMAQRDSVRCNQEVERFRWKKAILPASMIAVGSLGTFDKTFKAFNSEVKDELGEERERYHFHQDNWLQYFPLGAYVGLGFIPHVGCHSFPERLMVGFTSYALMALVVTTVKYTVREPRPDSSFRNSFPSGHTATAFLGAELIRQEYGNLAGTGSYILATGIAFLRLYNNRHWFSDVLAGAGIGILSAKAGYWLLPFERKLFGMDKRKRTMVVAPFYSPYGHSFGLGCTAEF